MSYSYRDSGMPRSNYTTSSQSAVKNYSLIEDVPSYGSAFVCGKSRFESEKFHVKNDPILQLSCGDEHTGIVTESGRVFMFGSNNWGQLGLGHENNVEKPSCIKSLKQEKSILIACGRNHTIVATDRGNIYTFGCNSESQLGLGEANNSSFYNSPQLVDTLNPQDWKMLSAGAGQSCAINDKGDLYVWGINDNGELGIGKTVEQFTPKRLDLGFSVAAVSCGYYHTAIISSKGDLYTSGSEEFYQLGHDRADKKFHQVEKIREAVRTVACGAGHTLFATEQGYVFAIGDGSKGQLGLGTNNLSSKSPRQIRALEPFVITHISAGECHTAFISNKGELLTCGDNRYGKLGHSQKTFNSIQYEPIIVDKYQQLNVKNVACGGCHMILSGSVAKAPKSSRNNKLSDEEKDTPNKSNGKNLYGSQSMSRREDDNDIPLSKRSNYDSMYASKRNNTDDYMSASGKKGGLPDLYAKSPRQLESMYGSRGSNKTSGNRYKDSDSEMENEEAEYTFNRTHTLTRDHGFVPLSETNLKKAAEESMNKFSSHNPNRRNNNNDDKKSNLGKKLGSDSEDEYLFNRKKFYNTKNQVEKRSFSPFDKDTGKQFNRPGNSPVKPFSTKPMNRQSDDSDEAPANRGHTSERIKRPTSSFNTKRNEMYRNSSTDMRVSEYKSSARTREDLFRIADQTEPDNNQKTEQVDTGCFKKKPSQRIRVTNEESNDRNRNRYERSDDDKYEPKSNKTKTCSIL